MTEHHSAPEIVVHRDHDDDWKRIGLVDDYGQKIELSVDLVAVGQDVAGSYPGDAAHLSACTGRRRRPWRPAPASRQPPTPAATSRTCSRWARSAAVSPPPSGYLKRNRAVATRYDKLTVRYEVTLHIAAIGEWLRPLTS